MDSITNVLNLINSTLEGGLGSSKWDYLLQICITVFSVVVGAFLGAWCSHRVNKKQLRYENNRKFLEDFNDFYIKVHNLFQEVVSYNELVHALGHDEFIYDFNESHHTNIRAFEDADKEYNNYVTNTPKGKFPNKDMYWEKVHQTCGKLKNFSLIIELASSLNQNAYISSLFVSEPLKRAFDRVISRMAEMSRNDYTNFNLQAFRLELIALMQIIKNEVTQDKAPIFFEHTNDEIKKGDKVKLSLFANNMEVIKVCGNRVICKNMRGKKFCLKKNEVELV